MYRRIAVLMASAVIVLGLSTRVFASTVTIQFTSASSYDTTYANAYAGIYNGTVNGRSTEFVCDDFLTEISNGQSWSAYANTNRLASNTEPVKFAPSTISNPLFTFGNPSYIGTVSSQQQEYNMVSWLVEQIFGNPTDSGGQWGAYAGAIWSLTDGAWNSPSYTASYGGLTAEGELVAAYSHRNDTNLPLYYVYTPNPLDAGQEFFSPVPEPATSLLLSIVLLVGLFSAPLLGARRQKRLSSR